VCSLDHAPENPSASDVLRARMVATMIVRIACVGVRNATLRDIARGCDTHIATIANQFANKEGLVAACFEEVAECEAHYLARLLDETRSMADQPSLLADLFWILIEDAATTRRRQTLVLAELLLAAPANSLYRLLARRWLSARRDFFRECARLAGIDSDRLDLLGLVLLSEATFAVSCFPSASYRMAAHLSLRWLAERLLAGHASKEIEAGMVRLSSLFYAAEPDPDIDVGPAVLPTDRARPVRSGALRSRAKMIDAAAAIIEEEGLSAVTNRAVAARAGVSLALTTYHFNSVNTLAFAGAVRVFQKTRRNLEEGVQTKDGARHIRTRADLADHGRRLALTPDAGGARNVNRGMVEISLAAARAPEFSALGIGMRRQRGVIMHVIIRRFNTAPHARAAAAVFAMWGAAVNLVADATGSFGGLYDIDVLAELASRAIAGEHDE
jgi:AcrR family transcriptional regulator